MEYIVYNAGDGIRFKERKSAHSKEHNKKTI
jgi:hypothetical protein